MNKSAQEKIAQGLEMAQKLQARKEEIIKKEIQKVKDNPAQFVSDYVKTQKNILTLTELTDTLGQAENESIEIIKLTDGQKFTSEFAANNNTTAFKKLESIKEARAIIKEHSARVTVTYFNEMLDTAMPEFDEQQEQQKDAVIEIAPNEF